MLELFLQSFIAIIWMLAISNTIVATVRKTA